jgi:hypothetical protein
MAGSIAMPLRSKPSSENGLVWPRSCAMHVMPPSGVRTVSTATPSTSQNLKFPSPIRAKPLHLMDRKVPLDEDQFKVTQWLTPFFVFLSRPTHGFPVPLNAKVARLQVSHSCGTSRQAARNPDHWQPVDSCKRRPGAWPAHPRCPADRPRNVPSR